MLIQMFSVHDSKIEAFIQPFFEQTVASAKRSFASAVNQEGHAFNTHGGDYTLFHLGSFNQSTAETKPLKVAVNLGLALTYISAPVHDAALAVVAMQEG